MPRRCVRALRVGDSDDLSNTYWELKKILYTKNFDIPASQELIYELEEHELVYLYWELVYTKIWSKAIKKNVEVFREMLIDDFMSRKYKRGRYFNG